MLSSLIIDFLFFWSEKVQEQSGKTIIIIEPCSDMLISLTVSTTSASVSKNKIPCELLVLGICRLPSSS